MPTDVLMPQPSPTMTEGRLSNWVKKEGDEVKTGMTIAEVETDKATMEVEAIDDGVLGKIFVQPGADIPVGTPIAVILGKGEKLPADYKPTAKVVNKPAEAPKAESKPAPAVKKAEAPKPAPKPVAAAPMVARHDGIAASPLARRLAAEWGVPLNAVSGTGPHGRIVKEDVVAARDRGVRGGGASTAIGGKGPMPLPASALPPLQEQTVPHTKMREIIAQRLVASKQQVPHFYLTMDVQMDAVLALREQLNAAAEGGYKLSVNDFIIKACALALRAHPNANASWGDKALQKHGTVDVSVAVAIDNGLVTPIIRTTDEKSLPDISNEMKDLAATARAGKLLPEQYQGGTFSVSNLGMYGIKHFDAIINPPQSAILACGAAEKRMVVNADNSFKVASVMTATLSVDHRVIDGALGAELLGSIKRYLENPSALV